LQKPGHTSSNFSSGSLRHAGRVLKDYSRKQIKITSKWGAVFTAEGIKMDMRRDACREACEGSLARLGVDYLDMMIFRGPPKDPYGTTIEQAVESMKVGGPEHVMNCLIWSMLLLCFPHLSTQSAIVDVIP